MIHFNWISSQESRTEHALNCCTEGASRDRIMSESPGAKVRPVSSMRCCTAPFEKIVRVSNVAERSVSSCTSHSFAKNPASDIVNSFYNDQNKEHNKQSAQSAQNM